MSLEELRSKESLLKSLVIVRMPLPGARSPPPRGRPGGPLETPEPGAYIYIYVSACFSEELFKKTLPAAGSSFMQVAVTTKAMRQRAMSLMKAQHKGLSAVKLLVFLRNVISRARHRCHSIGAGFLWNLRHIIIQMDEYVPEAEPQHFKWHIDVVLISQALSAL
jgi:hypothetical protein